MRATMSSQLEPSIIFFEVHFDVECNGNRLLQSGTWYETMLAPHFDRFDVNVRLGCTYDMHFMRHPPGVHDRADHDRRLERRLSIAGRIRIVSRDEIDRNWNAWVIPYVVNGTIRPVYVRALGRRWRTSLGKS
jgi:hypothetical protein